MKFADLNAYLAYYQANGGPALIPVDTVAYYRGVARPTALRMLNDGRLQGVDIEGDKYATVDSYIALSDNEKDRTEKVRQFIEKYARRGEIVTYGPVMADVHLRSDSPPDRTIIAQILGEISTASYHSYDIFLTAIVHKKYGAGTKPGPGYFKLVEEITGRKMTGDEATAVNKEVQKVFAHYQGRRQKSKN